MKTTTKKTAKPGRKGRPAAKDGDKADKRAAAGAAPAKKGKAPASARVTKTDTVVEMLRAGATVEELLKATGWQPHSLRGFISGTLRKKQGLTVTKGKDGKYKIAE